MSISDRYRIDSLKAELERVKAERDRYQRDAHVWEGVARQWREEVQRLERREAERNARLVPPWPDEMPPEVKADPRRWAEWVGELTRVMQGDS